MEENFDQLRHDLLSKIAKVPKTQAELAKDIGVCLLTLNRLKAGKPVSRLSRARIQLWLQENA